MGSKSAQKFMQVVVDEICMVGMASLVLKILVRMHEGHWTTFIDHTLSKSVLASKNSVASTQYWQ